MKSLALQPWKWFSSQWGLPSANQLCATEKPLNIFGPLYCGDNVSESKLWSCWTHPSLPTFPSLALPPPPLSSSVICFLNTFSSIFFRSAEGETPPRLICPGVIWLQDCKDWSGQIKTIDSPCAKTHSFTPTADSFLPSPGSRHQMTHRRRRGGGAEVSAVAILRPEERSELCVSLWCEQRLMTWAVQMKQQTRMVQRIFFPRLQYFPLFGPVMIELTKSLHHLCHRKFYMQKKRRRFSF